MAARQPDPMLERWRRVLASPWFLAAVLLLAAGLRVGYLVELRGTPWWDRLVVDPEDYDAWARQIAAGDWLGGRAFYMDPLYPYVLGAPYRIGRYDPWAGRRAELGL